MSLWDKRRRFGAGALLLGFLLLAGCAGEPAPEAPPLREPKGVTMDIVPVRRGEIWITETYEGLVLPRVRELSFPASGRMSGVNVCPGSHVKEGDLLASLDVDYARSALETQRSYLEYMEKNEEIIEREQEIQIQLKQLETAALRASGAGSSAVRLSELQGQELENSLRETKALWELDHADALESVKALEDTVERSRILAPCDGTVVSCAASDGSYAMENAGVIWLAEDGDLYLSVAPVSAAALDRADEVYAAVNGQRVEVESLSAQEAEGCREGQSAFRITEAGETPVDALIVPSSALHRDNSYFVYKVVDGVQVRQNVRCGVMNDAEVQILSGLEEGDQVYAGT